MAKWVWQKFLVRCSCGLDVTVKSQTEAMRLAHEHVCAGHELIDLREVGR